MRWRWAIVIAIGIYCVWGALLIAQNPGLQYDEAFLVAGAARMLHAAAPFDIPGSAVWVHAFHHLFPLMGGGQSYVGAVKDYLVLPFFALFGPSAAVVRVISMLLGAVGIWGIWKLIRQETGSGPAMAAALILAMNPAYINMTVFDNNAFPGFMAALGLVCASLAGYLRRRTAAAALLLGLAMGFGVWARANFIWLLAAGGAAALIVYGRRALAPAPHWVAIACGGIL
ncbi:MAG TPA: glycosyltransferase family 39 protein, partial [Bryobacteraceae bacterium]|nr:glycosyltransferase family 39 protein [Bryobacteraceae bacterium]